MMIMVVCNARNMWGHLLFPCCLPSLAWGVWQNQRGRILSARMRWGCVRGQNDQKREMQFALFEDLIWFWSSALALRHSSILETSYATFRSHVAFRILLEAAYHLVLYGLRQRSRWWKSFTKQVAACEDLMSHFDLLHLPWHSWKPFWSQFALLLLLGAFAKTKEAALRLMCGCLRQRLAFCFLAEDFFILILALFCLLLGNTIWQTSVQLLFAQN